MPTITTVYARRAFLALKSRLGRVLCANRARAAKGAQNRGFGKVDA
jgi:hypothetical protein